MTLYGHMDTYWLKNALKLMIHKETNYNMNKSYNETLTMIAFG